MNKYIWATIYTILVLIALGAFIAMQTERPKTQEELYMECYDKCIERGTKATMCGGACARVWREYSDAPTGQL